MAKYKLKALSCFLGGQLRKKEENKVFDSTDYDRAEFDALVKGGYFTEIKPARVEADPAKVEAQKPLNKAKSNG